MAKTIKPAQFYSSAVMTMQKKDFYNKKKKTKKSSIMNDSMTQFRYYEGENLVPNLKTVKNNKN